MTFSKKAEGLYLSNKNYKNSFLKHGKNLISFKLGLQSVHQVCRFSHSRSSCSLENVLATARRPLLTFTSNKRKAQRVVNICFCQCILEKSASGTAQFCFYGSKSSQTWIFAKGTSHSRVNNRTMFPKVKQASVILDLHDCQIKDICIMDSCIMCK